MARSISEVASGITIAALAAVTFSSAASAQSGPQQRRVDVTFTGTVTNPAIDQILIRQPDGSSAVYTGQVAADGIYRVRLSGANAPGSTTFGRVADFAVQDINTGGATAVLMRQKKRQLAAIV